MFVLCFLLFVFPVVPTVFVFCCLYVNNYIMVPKMFTLVTCCTTLFKLYCNLSTFLAEQNRYDFYVKYYSNYNDMVFSKQQNILRPNRCRIVKIKGY